jgi:hypothetical protein
MSHDAPLLTASDAPDTPVSTVTIIMKWVPGGDQDEPDDELEDELEES